jgi:hypothetical protein
MKTICREGSSAWANSQAVIMNELWRKGLVSGSAENGILPSRPLLVLMGEGRIAVEFLERAADWAADSPAAPTCHVNHT